MAGFSGPQLRLQQQIECQLEVKPRSALSAWEKAGWNEEPGADADEAPLKYLALALLDAVEERADGFSMDKDKGVTIFTDPPHSLPKAPPHYIARSLEILREITGLEGRPKGEGTLSLGIRGDSLDITLRKDAGLHFILIPDLTEGAR